VGDDGGVASDVDGNNSTRPAPPSLVETVVYAPLGFVLEARNLLPRLVERGRNQIALTKMMGQFAVRKGTEDLAAGAVTGQQHVVGVLRSLGVVPGRPGDPTPPPAPATPVAQPRVSPEAAAQAAGIDAADLAIPGYDLLSASQVVPRLASLSAGELDLVARYEAGTRGRKTILSKVAQLRDDPPPAP
jgi:hypothetical protein